MSETVNGINPNSKGVLTDDVTAISFDVNSTGFVSTFGEALKNITEFEQGFRFTPITAPAAPGVFFLTNVAPTAAIPDETATPAYSYVSDYYHLLFAHTTLGRLLSINPEFEHLNAAFAIRKQISGRVTSKDLSKGYEAERLYSDDIGDLDFYYLNSYDRTLREQVIIGDLMLSYKYVHRKSGLNKTDLGVLVDYLAQQENGTVSKALRMLSSDPVSIRTLTRFLKSVPNLSFRKIAVDMGLVSLDEMNTRLKDGEDLEEILFSVVKNLHRYRRTHADTTIPEMFSAASLLKLMRDIYRHLTVTSGQYDAAARFLDRAAAFSTTHILKEVGILDIL